MPAKRYMTNTAGRNRLAASIVTSAGGANDGDLVALDPSGKLDASVMPAGFGQNTALIVASEALAAGDLVNIHNSTGSKVRKADATTEGREADGFVLAAVANAATATVYLTGNRITGLTGMTPGARQFLATTAGTRTETPPSTSGNVVQVVGKAIDATTLIFEPEEPVTLA
jgi:hypothetical protein